MIRDGTKIVAVASGTVEISNMNTGKRLCLSNMLHAPEFTKNISSVARLSSSGNKVTFDGNTMVISNGNNTLICHQDALSGPGVMFYITGTVERQPVYDTKQSTEAGKRMLWRWKQRLQELISIKLMNCVNTLAKGEASVRRQKCSTGS